MLQLLLIQINQCKMFFLIQTIQFLIYEYEDINWINVSQYIVDRMNFYFLLIHLILMVMMLFLKDFVIFLLHGKLLVNFEDIYLFNSTIKDDWIEIVDICFL